MVANNFCFNIFCSANGKYFLTKSTSESKKIITVIRKIKVINFNFATLNIHTSSK